WDSMTQDDCGFQPAMECSTSNAIDLFGFQAFRGMHCPSPVMGMARFGLSTTRRASSVGRLMLSPNTFRGLCSRKKCHAPCFLIESRADYGSGSSMVAWFT